MNLIDASILVVDDEAALREIFTQWLKVLGCGDVRTACDGEAALRAIEERPINLLVTDVRMPVMNGVELVRCLGRLGRAIPSIVFVSGFGDVDFREMYDLGVEAFLSKPLRREDLIDCLKRAVGDRAELWIQPDVAAPRQTLSVEVETLGDCAAQGCLCLGRGGFSVFAATPLAIGKVTFTIRLAVSTGGHPEPSTWSGQGIVRWYSKTDQAVGIEFTYLDPECREAVLASIAATSPGSFIPTGMPTAQD